MTGQIFSRLSPLLHRAADCLDAKDPVSAGLVLDLVLARKPDDPTALAFRALAHVALDERGLALACLAQVPLDVETDPIALVIAAQAWVQVGCPIEGARAAELVLMTMPAQETAVVLLAEHHRRRGDPVAVLTVLTQARRADPSNLSFLLGLSAHWRRLGERDAAEYHARLAAAVHPDQAAAWHALALARLPVDPRETLVCQQRARQLGDDSCDGLNLEGLALSRLGLEEAAQQAFEAAIARDPQAAMPWTNLGNLLLRSGGADALPRAEAAFRGALQRTPESPEALNGFAQVLRDRGNRAGALSFARRALWIRPQDTVLLNTLGNLLRATGSVDEAMQTLKRALILAPDSVDTHTNLGLVYLALDEKVQAEACFRTAWLLAPTHSEVACNYACFLFNMGRHEECDRVLYHLLVAEPSCTRAWLSLASGAFRLRREAEAGRYFKRVLRLTPEAPRALLGLALVSFRRGQFSAAVKWAQKILDQYPGDPPCLNLIGLAKGILVDNEQGLDAYRRICESPPEPPWIHIYSNYCLTTNYGDPLPRDEIFRVHKQFNDFYVVSRTRTGVPHSNDRDPERRLRIGYTSPDFRCHSVAYFALPVIHGHDRRNVEVFCYSKTSDKDIVTEKFEALCDHWRDVSGQSMHKISDQIIEDKIDILVDLTGHTADNFLPTFSMKPAPIQVSYLGYPNTTGLSTMDYRLTDVHADPPGADDAYYTETLWRLPRTFLVYLPSDGLDEIVAPPVLERRHITFGSFNNTAKYNEGCVRVWQQILDRVPGSRLYLKSKAFSHAADREEILPQLAAFGLDLDRVDIASYTEGLFTHMQTYGRVDIALDTFPYNGTTTTMEALIMGVPVVGVRGDRHAARVGASLLTNLGLADRLLGETPEDMVEKAVALAQDLEALVILRATMRKRIEASALRDYSGFAADLEAAYRAMWRRWCSGPPTVRLLPRNIGDALEDLDIQIDTGL